MQRLVVFTACLCILGGCVTASSPTKEKLADPVNLYNKKEKSALDAWWVFFDDRVLDSLAFSALNLNSYNSLSDKENVLLDVVKNYMQYRYIQNQKILLVDYIIDKEDIIDNASKLPDDNITEIKKQQGNLIKKKIELEEQEKIISAEIARLTKLMPEYVEQVLKDNAGFPHLDIAPVLASSAFVIAGSTKIIKARTALADEMKIDANSIDVKSIFPDITIGRLFGVSDDVYIKGNYGWNISIGSAVDNLELSEFNARYAHYDSYNAFRNDIYEFIIDIEKIIISYSHMQEQYSVLKEAASKYDKKFLLLKERMADEDASFSSLIDICDEAYNTGMAALKAEYESSRLLVDLYGMLWSG